MSHGRIPHEQLTKQKIIETEAQQRFAEMMKQQRQMYLGMVATSYLNSAMVLCQNDFERASVFNDLAGLIAVRAGGSRAALLGWCGKSYDAQRAAFKRKDPQRYAEMFEKGEASENGEEVQPDDRHSVLLGADGAPVKVEHPGEFTSGGEADGHGETAAIGEPGAGSAPGEQDAQAMAEPRAGDSGGDADSSLGAGAGTAQGSPRRDTLN